jgi:hypothetical protein
MTDDRRKLITSIHTIAIRHILKDANSIRNIHEME